MFPFTFVHQSCLPMGYRVPSVPSLYQTAPGGVSLFSAARVQPQGASSWQGASSRHHENRTSWARGGSWGFQGPDRAESVGRPV